MALTEAFLSVERLAFVELRCVCGREKERQIARPCWKYMIEANIERKTEQIPECGPEVGSVDVTACS